jgi:hypothetical protein
MRTVDRLWRVVGCLGALVAGAAFAGVGLLIGFFTSHLH